MKHTYETDAMPPVKIALFDFDGTISTLRCGWETVMKPLMLEYLGVCGDEHERAAYVDAYIRESTGVQTIFQMKWLAQQAAPGMPTDPWWYKDEYNRRLMKMVQVRRDGITSGRDDPERWLISGARSFLATLHEKGVRLFAASGTDHEDVLYEAGALNVAQYFEEILGAPSRVERCSKEAVLRRILSTQGAKGTDVAIIGDGKVEIALGKEMGTRTLGMATDEELRYGVDETKKARLLQAGADIIFGDFCDLTGILSFLGFHEARKGANE